MVTPGQAPGAAGVPDLTGMIARPFPVPPRLVARAYRLLQQLAKAKTEEDFQRLGDLSALDLPWDPNRCGSATRQQLWEWLDDVAAWVNHEYGWGVERLIPPCWTSHPHIAHELAVLADQRYTAGQAFHSNALEEWHRYSLPMFLERMTTRLGSRCVNGHEEWPAAPRYRAFTSEAAQSHRARSFDADATAVARAMSRDRTAGGADFAYPSDPTGRGTGRDGGAGVGGGDGGRTGRHLVVVDQMVVDRDTGQVIDDTDDNIDDGSQL